MIPVYPGQDNQHDRLYRAQRHSKTHYPLFCGSDIFFDHSPGTRRAQSGGSTQSQIYTRDGGALPHGISPGQTPVRAIHLFLPRSF